MSDSTGLGERSGHTFVDDSTSATSGFGRVGRLQLVRDGASGAEGVLASAGAAMNRVERDIDRLWSDAMDAHDSALSQRLAELSHALQRAAHQLEHDDGIG